VKFLVTVNTNGYEIVFLVVPEAATRLNMMNLKIFHATTMLATPAIADQDRSPQSPIRFCVEF
jgi:hypothetical protein